MTKKHLLLDDLLTAWVGFDRLFDQISTDLERGVRKQYPPYDIIRQDDNNTTIEIAVAGYSQDQISVEVIKNKLHVKSLKSDETKSGDVVYSGIAKRAFDLSFNLAEGFKVTAAKLQNGLLQVSLTREVKEDEVIKVTVE